MAESIAGLAGPLRLALGFGSYVSRSVFFFIFYFGPSARPLTHYTQAVLAITFTLTARRFFGLQLNAQVRRSVTVS